MRLILLALLAKVQAYGIARNSCPIGYRRLSGFCIPDDNGIYDRQPVADKCECVPFYQCRSEDVRHDGCKCNAGEISCKEGAPPDDCGWGAIGSSFNETDHGEFPWIVAILNVTTNETWTRDEYIGGGSIVHPRYVLTAAHKVKRKDEKTMQCRAGQLMRLAAEPNMTQDRLVDRIMVHPAYDRQYLANDIALIRLKELFDVSLPTVRPVCVAKGLPEPPIGSKCFASGWERRQYNSSEQDVDKLKKEQLPLVPREVCWRALQAVDDARRRQRGQEPIRRRELHSSLLCAGGLEARDTCVGDGGSPLVCQLQMNSTHTRWAAFGLVAWGVGCGVSGAPGVYVDVGQYHSWIHNIVAEFLIIRPG